VTLNGADIEPTVAWGINPGQAVGVSEKLPTADEVSKDDAQVLSEAYEFTSFKPGQAVQDIPINVAFIGSCTNSRMSDLREAAKVAKGRHVKAGIKAIVVPGSIKIKFTAEKEGLDKIFREAGFEWREAGCSMCLAMNPDQLKGREICASSSNRNFKGRQGSATGRTLLMSPAMVAAAAVEGHITDVRKFL
jgi:3-isopropylmalate/(R)-2-methylmalate dehydratase large subunit